jgi:hypothetical protein
VATYPEALAAIETGALAKLPGTDAEVGIFKAGAFEVPIAMRLVIRRTMKGQVMRLVAYARGDAEYWTAVPFEPSPDQEASDAWELAA